MPVDVGDPAPIVIRVFDEDGVTPVNTGSVSVVVQPPVGPASASMPCTAVAVGKYVPDPAYPMAMPGRHEWTATATGRIEGTYEDVFVAGTSPGVVSLVDAADHLDWGDDQLADGRQAEQLRTLVVAASRACGRYIDQELIRTVVTGERHPGGTAALILRRGPVIEVTGVTLDGVAATTPVDGWDIDLGVLYHPSSRWVCSRPRGVAVTYVAGWLDPPEDLQLAVKRQVEHLWQRIHQAPHMSLSGDEDEFMLRDMTAALPWNVRALLEPFRVPGIA